jgi:osmotically-inducible protein OsmY
MWDPQWSIEEWWPDYEEGRQGRSWRHLRGGPEHAPHWQDLHRPRGFDERRGRHGYGRRDIGGQWTMGNPGNWSNVGGYEGPGSYSNPGFSGSGFSRHLGHLGPPVEEPAYAAWTRHLSESHFSRQHHGKGPRNWRRSDDRIHDEVCEALTEDGEVDASEIVVSVKEGEVTLSGEVVERRQKRRAEDVAERCLGVRDVHNELRVRSAAKTVESKRSKTG